MINPFVIMLRPVRQRYIRKGKKVYNTPKRFLWYIKKYIFILKPLTLVHYGWFFYNWKKLKVLFSSIKNRKYVIENVTSSSFKQCFCSLFCQFITCSCSHQTSKQSFHAPKQRNMTSCLFRASHIMVVTSSLFFPPPTFTVSVDRKS